MSSFKKKTKWVLLELVFTYLLALGLIRVIWQHPEGRAYLDMCAGPDNVIAGCMGAVLTLSVLVAGVLMEFKGILKFLWKTFGKKEKEVAYGAAVEAVLGVLLATIAANYSDAFMTGGRPEKLVIVFLGFANDLFPAVGLWIGFAVCVWAVIFVFKSILNGIWGLGWS